MKLPSLINRHDNIVHSGSDSRSLIIVNYLDTLLHKYTSVFLLEKDQIQTAERRKSRTLLFSSLNPRDAREIICIDETYLSDLENSFPGLNSILAETVNESRYRDSYDIFRFNCRQRASYLTKKIMSLGSESTA